MENFQILVYYLLYLINKVQHHYLCETRYQTFYQIFPMYAIWLFLAWLYCLSRFKCVSQFWNQIIFCFVSKKLYHYVEIFKFNFILMGRQLEGLKVKLYILSIPTSRSFSMLVTKLCRDFFVSIQVLILLLDSLKLVCDTKTRF